MSADAALARLGWRDDFAETAAGDETARILRIIGVQRDRATGHDGVSTHLLSFAPDMESGALAVGDWVRADADSGRILEIFGRRSLLSRRAAGPEARAQLIAANVDRLFIVTSCNADFNPARLERYVALALDSGIAPSILLTKRDLCDDPEDYVRRARAISPALETILLLNAKDPGDVAALAPYIERNAEGIGVTAALIGSSGVGKSTLINALTDQQLATATIRDDDAKGRHTTTARSLHMVRGGGVLIDMPGMRELGMIDAAEGIDTLFEDISDLAGNCRFSDCAHDSEPDCAVTAAIATGQLDPGRVARWKKLKAEDAHNTASVAESRRKARNTTRTHRAVQNAARGAKRH